MRIFVSVLVLVIAVPSPLAADREQPRGFSAITNNKLLVMIDGRSDQPAHELSRLRRRQPVRVSSAGPHTVTIGESRRFEQMGGAVSFAVDGGRVRFNVNLEPVEQRGVRISARMLKLASRVDRATPEKSPVLMAWGGV